MVLDNIYITPVRSDVFREISQRGTGKNKTQTTTTSYVGFGVADNTFILKKKIYNSILEDYKSIIQQISFGDDQDDDEMEYLFEEEKDELEMDIEEDPKESMHVNTQKRKLMENAIDRDMKRTKQDIPAIEHPFLLVHWYSYWSEKLNKGFLNDVPREFTNEDKAPTLDQFVQTKTGDAILKFCKFTSKQFL